MLKRLSRMFACRRQLLDSLLVFLFVLLFVAFFRRQYGRGSDLSNEQELEDSLDEVSLDSKQTLLGEGALKMKHKAFDNGMIDSRVSSIGDVRHDSCRRVKYTRSSSNDITVSVILTFTDYEFFDLKNTIGSLMLATEDLQLVKEILIVDDATSLDYILRETKAFIEKIPLARLLKGKHVEPAGMVKSRAFAVTQASSEYLVFLDCRTLVTWGWLEPLIELLQKDPIAVAVPHYDLVHDPVSLAYKKTSDYSVATFSWNLAVRMRNETTLPVTNKKISSPVLRGNAFAVRKEFLVSIGGYDVSQLLEDGGGGEHIEMSLRIWLCGGSIKVCQCSRVGIVNLNDPLKVTSRKNVVHIAEMWFGKRKGTVLRSASLALQGVTMPKSGPEVERAVLLHKQSIPRIDECRDIDWYLQVVGTSMVLPSLDAVRFGILRIGTGRCSKLLSSMRIKLDDCKPEMYNKHPPEMIFELTRDGLLKVMDKCLTTKDNAYILAEDCRPGEDRQSWKYLDEMLVNVWSKYCAMHVTDPDKRTEGDRQIAMAQDCATDSSSGSLFKHWEFVTI